MPGSTNRKLSIEGPSKRKIIVFRGISIVLVPLLILFLMEAILRLFHYGNDLNLFIEYRPNSQFLVFNPDASKRYFTNSDFATTGNSEPFKKKKDSNTMRIFVLGESTTIGYPYFHNGSFHRWLQYRLMHSFPDKNFEIINLSLTAVNSYTVLGFAKEVVNYEPDAVLIYTGHNEFYGALGAASTQNLGSNRFAVDLILKLRELKITQLITNIYDGIAHSPKNDDAKHNETRMQLMAENEQISYQSPLYEKGLSQFKANMADVFSLLQARQIPVFVSNLVSNERDLKPFISFADSSKGSAFKQNLQNGVNAYHHNNLTTAAHYFQLADKAYNRSADCKYYLGQLCIAQGDYANAGQYLHAAKDLDGLRFRAPEAFNIVVKQLSDQYTNVHLVDTHTAFNSFSDHGLIGDRLILDHVHPDLQGYAIMSDVFYTAIKKANLLPADESETMTFNQLIDKMPVNRVDSLAGVYRILNLKKHWPYNEPHADDTVKINSEEQSLAYDLVFNKSDWRNTMDVLYSYYITNHQYKNAGDVLEALILETPIDADLYEKLANLSGSLKDDKNTLYCFKRSFDLAPSFDKAKYIFVLYLKADKPGKALPYLNYAISNNTNGPNLDAVKNYTEDVIQLQRNYASDSTNLNTINRIANDYLMMSNKDAAGKYIQKALKLDAKNRDAALLVSKMNAIPN